MEVEYQGMKPKGVKAFLSSYFDWCNYWWWLDSNINFMMTI